MDFNVLPSIIYNAITSEAQNMPFLMLQAVAIVGCVATLLLYQSKKMISSSKSISVGLVMGLACFFMMALLHEHLQSRLKLIVVLDFIFVAGVVGGFRNVVVALVLVFFSRGIFGGTEFLLEALFDYIIIAIASLIGHAYFFSAKHGKITFVSVITLVLLRFVAGEVSLLLMAHFGFLPLEAMAVLENIIVRRAMSTWSISLLIILSVLLLIKQTVARERQFYYDPVTGLPNRREMEYILREASATKKKEAPVAALMLINIDNYTEMTQSRGHGWMDTFCAEIGQLLQNRIQKKVFQKYSPLIFSFSEKSYALILRNNISKIEVQQQGLANILHSALMLGFKQPKSNLQVSFSINVIDIVLSNDFNEVRFLRSLSLLEDHHTGSVQFFESTFEQQILLNEYLLSQLNLWDEHGGVPVWLQPKVTLEDGFCYGAEALLRVQDASGHGFINPHGLLHYAEKCKMRQDLEWGVINSVIDCLVKMPKELDYIKLSVNLTPDIFKEEGFGAKLIALMQEKNIIPNKLIIEIIETSKFVVSETVQDNISILLEAGVCLSLDDFGTGYASISLLSQYQFGELKLDYSMISNLDNPRVREAIAFSIEGAKRYNAYIVAEGIETEEQRELLLEMGVYCGQGFLFGKAMPFDNFVNYALKTS